MRLTISPVLHPNLEQKESEPKIPNNNLTDGNPLIFCEEKQEADLTDLPQNVSSTVEEDFSSMYIVELYRIVIPILLLVCLLSLLSNLLIACSSRWIRRRRMSPNLLLSLSLAGTDAFASLVVGLGLVLNSLLPIAMGIHIGQESACLVLTLEALRLGSLVSTALNLLALAANHHIGISNPLHYVHIVTRRNTLMVVYAIWICPIAFFFIYFSSVPNDGFLSPGCLKFEFLLHMPFRITTAVLFFIPLTTMTAIYTHIFMIVRRQQPQNNTTSSDRRLTRNVKAAVTTLLILGTYALGWMPAVLYFALTCLDCPAPFPDIPLGIRVPVGVFANAMIVTRCLVDPVLYLVRMPEVRDALLNMLGVQALTGSGSCPSSSQNKRANMRRLTLGAEGRKMTVYANARNVFTATRKEMVL